MFFSELNTTSRSFKPHLVDQMFQCSQIDVTVHAVKYN